MSSLTYSAIPGGGSPGQLFLNYTYVDHGMSPYTVLDTDAFLGCDTSTGTITILLPDSPTSGETYFIKDIAGQAFTSNITVTTVGGTDTIDGLTSQTMNTAFQCLDVLYNGSGQYLTF